MPATMLPGHKYFGPGTSNLNAGVGVDADDRHSHLHDLLYESAKTIEDIAHADRDFIEANIIESGPHSLLGAAGIAIKRTAEHLLGDVLYPSMSTKRQPKISDKFKKKHKSEPEEESEDIEVDLYGDDEADRNPPSIAAGNSSGSSSQPVLDVAVADSTSMNPQPGSSLPGGTGASVTPVSIGSRRPPSTTATYTKKWQIYTAGYQFKADTASAFNGYGDVVHNYCQAPFLPRALITPFACIDPNQLPWFMTLMEWDALGPWAKAIECRIKVVPLGYRLPFATNESTSTFANSQTLVQIATAVGLNHKTNGCVAALTTDASDLTAPTGITPDFPNGNAFWYGDANGIGANVGIPRHLNWYWTMLWSPPSSTDTSQLGSTATPNLLTHIDIININDCKGTPLINYSYRFKEGYLKFPLSGANNYQGGLPYSTHDIAFANSAPGRRDYDASSGVPRNNAAFIDGTANTQRNSADNRATSNFNSYHMPIEKMHFLKVRPSGDPNPIAPPHVNIACMPVQSNAALAPTPTFANVVAQWEVTCEIDVIQHYDYALPQIYLPWAFDYDMITQRILNYDGNLLSGLRMQAYVAGRLAVVHTVNDVWGPEGDTYAITNLQGTTMSGLVARRREIRIENAPPSAPRGKRGITQVMDISEEDDEED